MDLIYMVYALIVLFWAAIILFFVGIGILIGQAVDWVANELWVRVERRLRAYDPPEPPVEG